MSNKLNFWAVVPAAGIGKRMLSDCPKQYLNINDFSILYHSIKVFLQHPRISGVVIALNEKDPYWQDTKKQLPQFNKPIIEAIGGKERSDSVLSALKQLKSYQTDNCWAMVHDAARPCLLKEDVDKLIKAVEEYPTGALLGLPIVDTIKRCNQDNEIEQTVCREQLWRALTPQCFQLDTLTTALEQAYAMQHVITDEASAIELLGLKPKMIAGDPDNIKVTLAADLLQAKKFLAQQA